MSLLTISRIAEVLGASTKAKDAPVSGVSTDTRTLRPGQCFFAITGENFDGHAFVDKAIEKGASCVVVEKECNAPQALHVKNTIDALATLANWYRRQLQAKVIAITGSAGKTTTREVVYHVLRHRFKCHQSPKSYNNHIGVPLTLLSAPDQTEVLIAELGTSGPGEISRLSRIAEPDIALINNVHPAHLEGFGSVDAILREKAAIADGLRPGGTLILNANYQELTQLFAESTHKIVTFGQNPTCDVQGTQLRSNGSRGTLRIDHHTVEVPLPGRANLENVLAAWTICRECGVSMDEFCTAAKTLEPPEKRMEIEQLGSVTLVNDCYNANIASMENALDCLQQLGANEPRRRRVFICGQMAELGEQSEMLHKELGRLAAHHGVQLLLVCGPWAKLVADTAKKHHEDGLQARAFADTAQLCDNLHDLLQPDDIILVKGSRCAQLECAVEKLCELFGSD